MCGICGFATREGQPDRERFEAMIDVAKHRGPDGRGSFYVPGLALGHRRLAIVDLSPEGRQPFAYGPNQRYTLVYNGEIYNYIELRRELQALGYHFRSSCDTEVIPAAYDAWGEACVARFNGMWAFALYDRQENLLFCSRDRFGVKPFYYYRQPGVFAFASEIKQLLHMRDDAPAANPDTLAAFLALGQLDGGSGTLYRNILQLEAGHNLVLNLEDYTCRLWRWYDLAPDPGYFEKGYEAACGLFEERFTEAVALRLRADVPVGSCLSGGIDSSAIVGTIHELLAAQEKNNLQHTVSSCYDETAFNEQEYIDAVLEKTGAVGHKVFPVIDGDPAWLDRLVWHMDEPLPSPSGYSQWCVFEEAARQDLKVLLDGQGADEQLGGYSAFVQVYLVELLRQGGKEEYRRELEAYRELRSAYQPISTFTLNLFCRLTARLPRGLMRAVNGLYFRLRKPGVYSHPVWRKILLSSPQFDVPDTRAYIYGCMNRSLRLLLHWEDRNSMAHSVEARVPFLDPWLVESAYAMPFAYKIRQGVSKAVLRDGLRARLPEKVYHRHNKMGFPAPEAKWLALNRDWVEAQLRAACARWPDLLTERAVLKGFAAYLKRPQQGESVWWRIMCANRWAEVFGISA